MNWISSLFRRRKLYLDLSEEMRLHLEEREEQLMREGIGREPVCYTHLTLPTIYSV